MSSAVVSTSAALGRPFVFDDAPDQHVGTAAPGCPVEGSSAARREHLLQSTLHNQKIPPSSITPASQLEIRPAPKMASSGIPAIDALTGGLPRGCLTEVYGPASSGRTTFLLSALAAATRRGEFCVVVDASDALDPQSAVDSGVELDRLLWVRCGEGSPDTRTLQKSSQTAFDFNRTRSRELGSREPRLRETGFRETGSRESEFRKNSSRQSERRLEQVLRATDLLLESGGFGLIVLDLSDLPPQAARRIPLTTWFRFRRAVENKPTILLTIEQQPIAGSCSSLLLQLGQPSDLKLLANAPAAKPRKKICVSEQTPMDSPSSILTYAQLLTRLDITAELVRSRLDRRPACSITFETKTAWAG